MTIGLAGATCRVEISGSTARKVYRGNVPASHRWREIQRLEDSYLYFAERGRHNPIPELLSVEYDSTGDPIAIITRFIPGLGQNQACNKGMRTMFEAAGAEAYGYVRNLVSAGLIDPESARDALGTDRNVLLGEDGKVYIVDLGGFV